MVFVGEAGREWVVREKRGEDEEEKEEDLQEGENVYELGKQGTYLSSPLSLFSSPPSPPLTQT